MFVLLVREDGSKKEQCARLIRKFIFMRKLAFLSFPIRYWKALKMVIKMRLLWDEKKRQTERSKYKKLNTHSSSRQSTKCTSHKIANQKFSLFSFHCPIHGMCKNCDGVKRKTCIDLTINGFCFCAKVHMTFLFARYNIKFRGIFTIPRKLCSFILV